MKKFFVLTAVLALLLGTLVFSQTKPATKAAEPTKGTAKTAEPAVKPPVVVKLIVGEVKAIDATSLTLVVKKVKKVVEEVFTLTAKTKYFDGVKPCKAEDVKVGAHVKVYAKEKVAVKVVIVKVKEPIAPKKEPAKEPAKTTPPAK